MPPRAQLNVTVQIATPRAGVPHAGSFATWARAAWSAGRSQSTEGAAELTIRIVGAAESRRLNRAWRGKDKPTNVLSFPGHAADEPRARSARRASPSRLPRATWPLGDLAICAPVVAREAREQGKAARAHWAHMVVHGVLHLLGYDHENDRDARRMEAREVTLLAQFGYPDPYG